MSPADYILIMQFGTRVLVITYIPCAELGYCIDEYVVSCCLHGLLTLLLKAWLSQDFEWQESVPTKVQMIHFILGRPNDLQMMLMTPA